MARALLRWECSDQVAIASLVVGELIGNAGLRTARRSYGRDTSRTHARVR